MGNVVPFDQAQVPAHLSQRFGGVEANTDLTANTSAGGFPVISYKGKVWAVVEGDDRDIILGEDGEPRRSIDVVLVKANAHVSKNFYEGGYVEGSAEKPNCYSHDGIAPAPDAQVPQSANCAVCPHNQWGSRITEAGTKAKSCADNRRMAVVPEGDLARPMLLRVPAASLRELVNYAKMLSKRNAPYQAVVTRVGFNHEMAHPQFTFKPVRWLSDEEAQQIVELMQHDLIDQIIGASDTQVGTAAEPEEAIAGTPPAALVAQPKVAPAPVPAPAPRPTSVSQLKVTPEEVEQVLEEAAPATAARKGAAGFGGAPKAPKTVAAKAPKATKPPAPAAAPAPVAPRAAPTDALLAEADQSLDDILNSLDD